MVVAFDPLKASLKASGPGHSEFRTGEHRIYDGLPAADFSRQVLTTCTERLAVLGLGEVGWSDLGTPERAYVRQRKCARMRGCRVAASSTAYRRPRSQDSAQNHAKFRARTSFSLEAAFGRMS